MLSNVLLALKGGRPSDEGSSGCWLPGAVKSRGQVPGRGASPRTSLQTMWRALLQKKVSYPSRSIRSDRPMKEGREVRVLCESWMSAPAEVAA